MLKHSFFKNLGMRQRLLIILISTAVLLSGCYIYIFFTLNRQTYSSLDTSSYQTAASLLDETASAFTVLDKTTSYLLQEHYRADGTDSVFSYFDSSKISRDDINQLSSIFSDATQKLFYLFPSLEGLYLYTTDGTPLTYSSRDLTRLDTPHILVADVIDEIISRNGMLTFIGSTMDSGEYYLYGARTLIDLQKSFAPSCIILAQMDISMLETSFSRHKTYPEQTYALCDADGEILAASGHFPMKLLTGLLTNTEKSYSDKPYIRLHSNGFFFHIVQDTDTGRICILSTPDTLISLLPFILIVLSLLLILFLSVLFFRYTFRSISKPIEELAQACQEIGQGDFSVRLTSPPDRELSYLTDAFNKMGEQIENLIDKIYVKSIAERDLELQLLRSQINPHFLYNTLESIRMTAYTEGVYSLSDMCRLMANVFRYGVSSQNELVSLGEEISHLKEYIELQQYRFHYSIQISVMIGDELFAFSSLKLIFQPIVENALNHGFNTFSGAERITIFGYEKEGILYFQVTDNGIGISEENCKLLNDYIQGKNNEFKSIGLKNVHRRISLYYGSEYGLLIKSRKGKGTSVYIKIPAQIKEDTNHV